MKLWLFDEDIVLISPVYSLKANYKEASVLRSFEGFKVFAET